MLSGTRFPPPPDRLPGLLSIFELGTDLSLLAHLLNKPLRPDDKQYDQDHQNHDYKDDDQCDVGLGLGGRGLRSVWASFLVIVGCLAWEHHCGSCEWIK